MSSRILMLSPAFLISLCLAAVAFNPSFATVTVKPIATGVTLTEEIDQNPPQIIHVLTVDLTNPNVHIEPIPGQDTITGPSGDIHQGRQEVRITAQNHDAVAAVNGDYFPFTGDPLGAAVWNGNLYSEPYPGRCVMGIARDGHTVMFGIVGFFGELQSLQGHMCEITGVDRMVSATDPNDLVVFTPTFGPKTGIRPGCVEVVLTGVNLPLRSSKLMTGTVTQVNVGSNSGVAIPEGGVILSALPNGPSANFLTSNFHVGDPAEFVCSIAPQLSLSAATQLSLRPRDANDLPSDSGPPPDPDAYRWATAQEVIGGGPHLVVGGQVDVDAVQEGFKAAFIDDPNPRTGVGVTADGRLLLVTVDGRQGLSRGVSLDDFASILKRYGAMNAMNLDGGGSTTMVAEGLLINSIASTGVERPVANSLCVFAPPLPGTTTLNTVAASGDSSTAATSSDPTGASSISSTPASSPPSTATIENQNSQTVQSPFVTITGLPSSLTVGNSAQLAISDGTQIVSGSNPTVLWQGSVNNGIAYVDQTGHLTALEAGQGVVTALYRGKEVQQQVTITSGTVAESGNVITGTLTVPDSHSSQKSVLVVGVYNQWGMPVPNTRLQINVSDGEVDNPVLVTDIDGEAQANILWQYKSGGSVTVSSDGLMSKVITQP